MMENIVINKKLNKKNIRIIWNQKMNNYYICIIDIVNALLVSREKSKYSAEFKKRLRENNIRYNRKDFCNIDDLINLLEDVPTKKSDLVKFWLFDIKLENNNICNKKSNLNFISKKQLENIKIIFNI